MIFIGWTANIHFKIQDR